MADGRTVVLHGTSSQTLLTVLLSFRRTKKFCDITLVSGERNFYAHCCILAAVSPYFLGMLRSGMSEVKSKSLTVDLAFLSVSPSSVSSTLDFVYGEDIEVGLDNVFELLVLADYLLLADLKKELCRYICQNMAVDPDTCFQSRRYAELYGCKALYEFADRFLKTRFYQLSQTPSFCELSLEELEHIAQSDELAANENEVFHSIIKWINYLPDSRKEHLDQLLQHIKPNTLSEEYIEEVLLQNNLPLPSSFSKSKGPFESSSLCPQGRLGQQVVVAFGDKSSLCYLPLSQKWSNIKAMPKSRHSFKAAELNGLIYILGGVVENRLSSSVWSYNPEKNQWSGVAPMLKTASSFALASLNGHLYAVGGRNQEHNVQQYDPKLDTWSYVKPMRVQRDDHCLVAFQDKSLFAIGGFTTNTQSLYSVERYDLESNTWTDMAELNIGRIESSAIAVKDKIFVVGGYGGSQQRELTSCEVYQSVSNTWCLIASTVSPRRGAGIALVAGKVYIFGGNPGKHILTEYYCEESQSWKQIGLYMNAGQKLPCCTVMLSGRAICNLLEYSPIK